ncbi:MAG: hypothetical protein KJO66_07945, partial [Gammaproteobacteria bacterium]|nr:hypothetical protein [Gammaproteobacteria bacterium]
CLSSLPQINVSTTEKRYKINRQKCLLYSAYRKEIMCRRMPGTAGVNLVISGCKGAEAAVIRSSEYHPLAVGNSGTYNVDGALILTSTVVWGGTLSEMPRP